MVNYCCVPNCKSTSSTAGVSMHEFPSNLTVRDVWIRNISRKDWTPINKEVVCSLHFNPDDFKTGLKRRFLKPTAAPTNFSTYPSYMVRSAKKRASTLLPRRRRRQQQMRKHHPTPRPLPSKGNKKLHEGGTGTNLVIELPAVPTTTCNVRGEGEEAKIVPPESRRVSRSTNTSPSRQRQKKCFKYSTAETAKKVKTLQSMLSVYRNRYAKTRLESDRIKSQMQQLAKKMEILNVDVIIGDREKGLNLKAAFLYDLLVSYSRKKTKFSDVVTRQCLQWRNKWPASYGFCKENLMTLPSRSTLQRLLLHGRGTQSPLEEEEQEQQAEKTKQILVEHGISLEETQI